MAWEAVGVCSVHVVSTELLLSDFSYVIHLALMIYLEYIQRHYGVLCGGNVSDGGWTVERR
jgi:hypothetical protein